MHAVYFSTLDAARAPLPADVPRIIGADALRACILAAAERAPDPEAPGYCAGPSRAPEDCAEIAGPCLRGNPWPLRMFADVRAWRGGELQGYSAEEREPWHGPLAPRPPAFVVFPYTVGSTRGRIIAPNVRGEAPRTSVASWRTGSGLLALAAKVSTGAAMRAWDGKRPARPPRPGLVKGSAPREAARAAWEARDYSTAVRLAEAAGAVFFGHTARGPILYVSAEPADACGIACTIGRAAYRGGRFRVLHTASALAIDSERVGAPADGFRTAAAALDWLEERAACEDFASKLRAAVATAAPFDQAAARAALLASDPDEATDDDETAAPADAGSEPAEDAHEGVYAAAGSPNAAADDAAQREAAANAPTAANPAELAADPAGADAAAYAARLSAACVARFGVADPDACRHLPAFAAFAAELAANDPDARPPTPAAPAARPPGAPSAEAARDPWRGVQPLTAAEMDAWARAGEAIERGRDPATTQSQADPATTQSQASAGTPATQSQAKRPKRRRIDRATAAREYRRELHAWHDTGSPLGAPIMPRELTIGHAAAIRAEVAEERSADSESYAVARSFRDGPPATTQSQANGTATCAHCDVSPAGEHARRCPAGGALAPTLRQSFAAGFAYGSQPGAAELTPRQIAERFPDADPDAFQNGMLDGIAGDRWRLDGGRVPCTGPECPPATQSHADAIADAARDRGTATTQSQDTRARCYALRSQYRRDTKHATACMARGEDDGGAWDRSHAILREWRELTQSWDAPRSWAWLGSGECTSIARDGRTGKWRVFRKMAGPYTAGRAFLRRTAPGARPATTQSQAIDAAEVRRLTGVYVRFAAERRAKGQSAADAIGVQRDDARQRAEGLAAPLPERAAEYAAAAETLATRATYAANLAKEARAAASARAESVTHRPLSHHLREEAAAVRDAAAYAPAWRAAVERIVADELSDEAARLDFDAIRTKAAVRRATAERIAAAAEFPECGGGSVRMVHADGRHALAGPCFDGDSPARLTMFDEAGPSGHTGWQSLADAVATALALGFEVDAEPLPPATQSQGETATTQSQGSAAADPSATQSQAKAPRVDSSGRPVASWIIRERATGRVVFETFAAATADNVNAKRYEAVPIADHLASLNGKPSPVDPGARFDAMAERAEAIGNTRRAAIAAGDTLTPDPAETLERDPEISACALDDDVARYAAAA